MILFLIRSAMCAMMPSTDLLPGVADTNLDGFLMQLRRDSDLIYWLGVVFGAFLFTVTPLLTVGIPLPSFLLPRRFLERHTHRILTHPVYLLRQAVYLVRLTAGMCWGSDPKVRARFKLGALPPDPGTFRTK